MAEYRRYLTRDIDPVLSHIRLSTLSQTDIGKWVNQMEADSASGKTIANKAGFLSGCLNVAVPKHISANPAAGIGLPRTVRRKMTNIRPHRRKDRIPPLGLLALMISDFWRQ